MLRGLFCRAFEVEVACPHIRDLYGRDLCRHVLFLLGARGGCAESDHYRAQQKPGHRDSSLSRMKDSTKLFELNSPGEEDSLFRRVRQSKPSEAIQVRGLRPSKTPDSHLRICIAKIPSGSRMSISTSRDFNLCSMFAILFQQIPPDWFMLSAQMTSPSRRM